MGYPTTIHPSSRMYLVVLLGLLLFSGGAWVIFNLKGKFDLADTWKTNIQRRYGILIHHAYSRREAVFLESNSNFASSF